MADTPISLLPVSAGALDADQFPVNQGGVTVKLTLAQVRTTVLAAHLASSPATHAVGSVTASLIADRTRKFFVVPYMAHNSDANTYAYMGQSQSIVGLGIDAIDNEFVTIFGRFMVPEDYVSGLQATPVWCIETGIAGTPKDLYIETDASSGACGESWEQHTDQLPFATFSVAVPPAPVSSVYQCSPALSIVSAAKDDLIEIYTIRDSTVATGGSDTLNDRCVFIGWKITYTADS